MKYLLLLPLVLLALWLMVLPSFAAPTDAALRIGSKRFTESYILAELLAQQADVEVGAGTTVLWDFNQEESCPGHHFLNAAVLLTRVVSKPSPGHLCFDLGHKSVASEMPHPRVRLFGLEDAIAVVHSEEHLVLKTQRASDYQIGDVVYGIPRHVCPTMALHSEVWAVRDGVATERWPVVARARRLTI